MSFWRFLGSIRGRARLREIGNKWSLGRVRAGDGSVRLRATQLLSLFAEWVGEVGLSEHCWRFSEACLVCLYGSFVWVFLVSKAD